ncbi:hypothetical protein PIB30_026733 [Stylosanthes scabra]|uniref:Uncharacterized protein n=1 Tax=Stylosanthes scabra TaxID=79078 RepID=A0ABU6UAV8_9FABA|nr:hypothetical protein [Stylosanthes scabra]
MDSRRAPPLTSNSMSPACMEGTSPPEKNAAAIVLGRRRSLAPPRLFCFLPWVAGNPPLVRVRSFLFYSSSNFMWSSGTYPHCMLVLSVVTTVNVAANDKSSIFAAHGVSCRCCYSVSLEWHVVGDAAVEIVAVRSYLLSGVELLPLELTVFGAYSWSIGNKNPAMWNRFTWGWSRFAGLEAIEGSKSSPSESILLLMESRTIGSSKCMRGLCFHVGQRLTSRLTVAAEGPPAIVPATNLGTGIRIEFESGFLVRGSWSFVVRSRSVGLPRFMSRVVQRDRNVIVLY